MLFEAFFWNPGYRRPAIAEFLRQPEFEKLLAHWGRAGDTALVAEDNGAPVGAAWCRLYTFDNHSYGFVDPATPETGMAVAPGHRSRGIGRRLLRSLIDTAKNNGFISISLSVDPLNHARKLYESEGFSKVGESGTSWTMLLKFPRQKLKQYTE